MKDEEKGGMARNINCLGRRGEGGGRDRGEEVLLQQEEEQE